MKRAFLLVPAAIALCVFSAFIFLELQTVRSLERLGIPADMIKQSVWYSLSGGYMSAPNAMKLKQIATGERAAVVREIADFAKSYSRSEEFKKQYLGQRDAMKPTPPEAPKTSAQRRKEDKESMQKSIKEAEANMRTMPAEYRSTLQQTIDMMKLQMKEIDKPDNPAYSAQVDEVYQQSYQQQMQEYKEKLAQWEQDYPADPKPMIKKWLTKFLDESRDVDFTAKLVPGEGGTMVFANAEYENKSGNWKMCYRAGRDVVQAGRAAAQQWLNELR
jgi:hypothetical protein